MALYAWALTSLSDVKESLGITDGSKDSLITRKINQATDMIEGYVGLDHDHHLKETTYTNEEYAGTGTIDLILKARPVTAVSSIQARDSITNDPNFTTLDTENYFIDEHSGVVGGLSSFYGGYNRWRVSYTAGFSTIPADLAEAAVILAGFLVDNASSGGAAIKSKQEGQRKIEYFNPSEQSTDSLIEQLGIDDMLARYVRFPLQDQV